MKKILFLIPLLFVSQVKASSYLVLFNNVAVDNKTGWLTATWTLVRGGSPVDSGPTSMILSPLFQNGDDGSVAKGDDRASVVRKALVDWAAQKVKTVSAADIDSAKVISKVNNLLVSVDDTGATITTILGSGESPKPETAEAVVP